MGGAARDAPRNDGPPLARPAGFPLPPRPPQAPPAASGTRAKGALHTAPARRAPGGGAPLRAAGAGPGVRGAVTSRALRGEFICMVGFAPFLWLFPGLFLFNSFPVRATEGSKINGN